MFNAAGQLQRSSQRMMRKHTPVSKTTPCSEKVLRQSARVIHVSVRQPKTHYSNNNLPTTQNAWDNDGLSINSINTQERSQENQQQQYYKLSTASTLSIANNQRPNKSDFVREYCNFSKGKQSANIRRKRRNRWPFSYYCIPACILSTLLIAAAIAAIILGLLTKQKSSTTTGTTMTTTTMMTASTTTITSTVTTTSTTTTKSTTTTTTTTVTTTTTSTSTSSSTTSRTTTTTTSTTTTPVYCGQSCVNQSWIDSSGDLALWPFDDSYNDTLTSYNAIPSLNQPTFVSGYFARACSFNVSAKQALYTSFIPLNNVSFTIDAWIQPTGYPNPSDHSIIGLCPALTSSRCLHISIRNAKLYFGFYFNDVQGATTILLNQWIHTAFVFDVSKKTLTIYLNGVQDGQASVSSALLVTSGNFTIGMNENVRAPNNYYQGYIDHLAISLRAKSSCEILEKATLAAHFEFDNGSPYTDSGPNAVATTSSTASIIVGYKNQGISFSGLSTSYFQAEGFTSLGISDQAFSVTFWIRPQTLSGTLVHLSASSSGNGSGCFPLLGFASNGTVVAQVLTNNITIASVSGSVLPVSSSWTLIVQTWSATNGLKLYLNNTLVQSITASTFKGSGITPNYLTLGNCLSGCSACSNGLIGSPGPFTGAIDDWRIYNRALTSADVCTLFYTT